LLHLVSLYIFYDDDFISLCDNFYESYFCLYILKLKVYLHDESEDAYGSGVFKDYLSLIGSNQSTSNICESY